MFDIGLGEVIVLAVLALLVFGPDHLPGAASSAGKFVRQMREMATSARRELSDSAGIDGVTDDLKSLRDLHPKRIIASAFSDEPPASAAKAAPPQPTPGVNPNPGATAHPGSGSGQPTGYDPDAT